MEDGSETGDARFFARLVSLADSLVSGFDLLELADQLLDSCVEFLRVSNAGILIDDQRGHLRVLASTSEATRLLELFELQNDDGPCLDAFASGQSVLAPALSENVSRWPAFVREASQHGIVGTYALPMRLRDRTIGALNLFCASPGGLSESQLHIAHVMSDMATLGIINHWTVQRHEVLAQQLQVALDSRIVIEQAKGVLSERAGLEMADAFAVLRTAARRSRRPLTEVARDVATGRLPALGLVDDTAEEGDEPDPSAGGPVSSARG